MKHYLGICLVLLTGAAVGLFTLHSCTQAVDQSVANVRDAFSQVFNIRPEVRVNQRIVLTQTAPIAELAVVTKEELVTIGFDAHLEVLSFQVPLTEKKASAEAVYRIKAGFDLHEPFSVSLESGSNGVHASMPPAKILSVEQIGDLTFHGEDGTLNKVTDDERAQILNNLNAAAHDEAEKSGLKEDAQKQVSQRLQEIFQHNGQRVDIEWAPKS
jgi:hypothetical protein